MTVLPGPPTTVTMRSYTAKGKAVVSTSTEERPRRYHYLIRTCLNSGQSPAHVPCIEKPGAMMTTTMAVTCISSAAQEGSPVHAVCVERAVVIGQTFAVKQVLTQERKVLLGAFLCSPL